MITEELMKPRYKVIAMYPGSHHEVGCVLHKTDYGWGTSIKNPFTPGEFDFKGNPDLFPAIFKKLQWWEERKPEDMPEYLKDAFIPATSEYYKVYKAVYDFEDNTIFLDNCPLTLTGSIHRLLPATESDYLLYKK